MKYPKHYLEFTDTAGLELQRFATFRLSGGWAKRLTKGETVFLLDVKARQVIGCAKVLLVAAGRAQAVLDQHAIWSHIELGNPGWSQAGADNAVTRRFASLQATYGPHKFTETSILSVIYLRRMK